MTNRPTAYDREPCEHRGLSSFYSNPPRDMKNLASDQSIMKRTPLLALLILGIGFFSGTSTALAFRTEAELLAILADKQSSAAQESEAFRHLAIVATERSVPVLAKRLGDSDYSHFVRYALEPIPSPAVDAAFREAIPKLKGKELIGLISSIGNRQDAKAIPALAKLLGGQDADVAKAAANGLARLGTVESARIFGEVSTADFSEPILTCAKTLTKQGHSDEATKLFTLVSKESGCSKQARNAAKLHLILLAGDLNGIRSALTSSDPGVFNLGLRAARLVSSSEAAKVALGLISDAPKQRQSRLIALLGDLGEPTGRAAVIEAAQSELPEVRVAAFGALRDLGTVDQVPLLLKATSDSDPQVAAQAEQTLVDLDAEGVDRVLLELMKAKSPQHAVVIRMAGKRKISDTLPLLLSMLEDSHQLEVIGALGELVSLDEMNTLGTFLENDSNEIRKAARLAIHTACTRMPDRAATVAFLASYLDNAPEDRVAFVYDELRQIGGAAALRVVTKAAEGKDLVQKDHATRALGKWVDTTAGDVLLAIAKSEGGSKYGIRCLRGYIRLTRQFPSMQWDVRLKMCQEVLQTAVRKEEKVLIFESLLRYGYTGELGFSIKARKDPEIADEAEACAIAIAKKLGVKRKDVRDALTRAGIAIPSEVE